MKPKDQFKPYAYQVGRSDKIVHLSCWDQWSAEVWARTNNRAFIGDMYAVECKALKGKHCECCKGAL